MKKAVRCLAITFFILLALPAGMCLLLFAEARPVTGAPEAHTARVQVPTGTSVREVAETLEAESLIRSGRIFYAAARFPLLKGLLTGSAAAFELKSGVYDISSAMSLARIFEILSSGRRAFIRVSFPEGLTISKIASRAERAEVCSAAEFRAAARDSALLEKYRIPADSFEGYLFPDTYFFTPSMTGAEVVSQMADNFFDRIGQIPGLAGADPAALNRAVILASIVEREYRIDEEAPLIASVFSNRLAAGAGLYSCATIEYIITEIEGRPHPDVITYDDLAVDSPYNTYKWAGLPPGPISNPGAVALAAAADPPVTDYFYFRLVDPAAGRHAFSRDFSAHISEGYIHSTKKASGN